ncbi:MULTISPECIES: hypothetical protein [unclassified Archaeoglobus]|jgi:hypothetical protein|uniref:hypothetical protein n=1 Tax=unclassified Archaeoglobus TaxID=2643606 RepID=UPI0025BDF466|nr:MULTISPECIES: hypothetical protein [unclassified Archaeoglobus]
MKNIKQLKKKIIELESLAIKANLAVFISNKPHGKVISEFNDLEKAKQECKRISKKLNIPDLSWLIEISDDDGIPQPPFYVCVDEDKIEMRVVEVGD